MVAYGFFWRLRLAFTCFPFSLRWCYRSPFPRGIWGLGHTPRCPQSPLGASMTTRRSTLSG
jgi:hypothetical protein